MSNHPNASDLRDEIARAEAADARLALQLDDLAQRRSDVEGERKRNARRAEALRSDLRTILEEPQKAKQFEAALAGLKSRLANLNAPRDRKSPTVIRVRDQLAALEADETTTSAEKLHRAQSLSRDLSERILLDQREWDANERKAVR